MSDVASSPERASDELAVSISPCTSSAVVLRLLGIACPDNRWPETLSLPVQVSNLGRTFARQYVDAYERLKQGFGDRIGALVSLAALYFARNGVVTPLWANHAAEYAAAFGISPVPSEADLWEALRCLFLSCADVEIDRAKAFDLLALALAHDAQRLVDGRDQLIVALEGVAEAPTLARKASARAQHAATPQGKAKLEISNAWVVFCRDRWPADSRRCPRGLKKEFLALMVTAYGDEEDGHRDDCCASADTIEKWVKRLRRNSTED